MVRPVPGRIRTAVALATVVVASVFVASPAAARAIDAGPTLISPTNGAELQDRAVVLEWEAVDGAAGYEVRWGTDPALDEAGRLTNAQSRTTESPVTVLDVEDGLYLWQARSAIDGPWSPVSTFTVGVQLETVPGPGVAPEPTAAAVEAASAVPGGIWVAIGFGFAAVLLVAVGIHARRVARDVDS